MPHLGCRHHYDIPRASHANSSTSRVYKHDIHYSAVREGAFIYIKLAWLGSLRTAASGRRRRPVLAGVSRTLCPQGRNARRKPRSVQ